MIPRPVSPPKEPFRYTSAKSTLWIQYKRPCRSCAQVFFARLTLPQSFVFVVYLLSLEDSRLKTQGPRTLRRDCLDLYESTELLSDIKASFSIQLFAHVCGFHRGRIPFDLLSQNARSKYPLNNLKTLHYPTWPRHCHRTHRHIQCPPHRQSRLRLWTKQAPTPLNLMTC